MRCPLSLAAFTKAAVTRAARYAVAEVRAVYDAAHMGGPYCCEYRLPGWPEFERTCGGQTPAEALEALEEAIAGDYFSNFFFSRN